MRVKKPRASLLDAIVNAAIRGKQTLDFAPISGV
jgi:hypothetical protein